MGMPLVGSSPSTTAIWMAALERNISVIPEASRLPNRSVVRKAMRKPSTISEIATFQAGTLGETAVCTFCRPKTIQGQRPVSASSQPQTLAR